MNLLVEILNAASVVVTTVIGALSVVHDYKDKEGRVTVWGRRAIIAIVATSAIALATQGVKIWSDREAKRAAEEKEAQLKALENRIHNPVGRFVVTLDVELAPAAFPDVRDRKTLEARLKETVFRIGLYATCVPVNVPDDFTPGLSIELNPFVNAEPPFLLPADYKSRTAVKVQRDKIALEMRSLIPVISWWSPEMTGWNDLAGACLRITNFDLQRDQYRVTFFNIRNERGMLKQLDRTEFRESEKIGPVQYGRSEIDDNFAEIEIDYHWEGVLPTGWVHP